jgi:hypothetical protein
MDSRSSFFTWCEKGGELPKNFNNQLHLLQYSVGHDQAQSLLVGIIYLLQRGVRQCNFAVPMNSFGLLSAGMSLFLFKNVLVWNG